MNGQIRIESAAKIFSNINFIMCICFVNVTGYINVCMCNLCTCMLKHISFLSSPWLIEALEHLYKMIEEISKIASCSEIVSRKFIGYTFEFNIATNSWRPRHYISRNDFLICC